MTVLHFNGVLGSHDADVITGTPGVDILAGFGGDDKLSGRAGDDALSGNGGADTFFYFGPSASPEGYSEGIDIITDFSLEEGDRIDLSWLSAQTPNGLTFTGSSAGAYSVYCQENFDARDHAIERHLGPGDLGMGVLMALRVDLDGDVQNGAELSIGLAGVEGFAAASLGLTTPETELLAIAPAHIRAMIEPDVA